MGAEKIFEIKTCYRNSEKSPIHLSECQMLEWYQNYVSLDESAKDTENVINSLNYEFKTLKTNKIILEKKYLSNFN